MLTEPKVWSRLIKRTAGTSSPFTCEEYCKNKSDVYSPKCLLAVTSCISFLCPCSQVAGATLAAAVSLILTVTRSAKKRKMKNSQKTVGSMSYQRFTSVSVSVCVEYVTDREKVSLPRVNTETQMSSSSSTIHIITVTVIILSVYSTLQRPQDRKYKAQPRLEWSVHIKYRVPYSFNIDPYRWDTCIMILVVCRTWRSLKQACIKRAEGARKLWNTILEVRLPQCDSPARSHSLSLVPSAAAHITLWF